MSEDATARLRKLQERFAADAASTHTREDLNRLRMYWGDVQSILDSEDRGE